MRIYCKNGYVVAADPKTDGGEVVRGALGHLSFAVPKGVDSGGGLILLGDSLKTCGQSHEIEVLASETPDLPAGSRGLVYLGGDDGSVAANGISAFFPVGDRQCFSVPEAFVWGVVRDGEVLPRGRAVLVERDDEAHRRYAMNSSVIHAPGVVMEHGVSATGSADPHEGGARQRDSVTVLYSRVVRTGPEVRDPELQRGAVVCYSPSYSCCRLERAVRRADGTLEKRHYALLDSEEIFFAVSG